MGLGCGDLRMSRCISLLDTGRRAASAIGMMHRNCRRGRVVMRGGCVGVWGGESAQDWAHCTRERVSKGAPGGPLSERAKEGVDDCSTNVLVVETSPL